MSTIVNALCALIPDGLEQWLAGGGSVAVILALLAVLALAPLLPPHHQPQPRIIEVPPAPLLPARPALEDMTLGEMFAHLRRLDQAERAARQQGGTR